VEENNGKVQMKIVRGRMVFNNRWNMEGKNAEETKILEGTGELTEGREHRKRQVQCCRYSVNGATGVAGIP
jgi:hypothetical protein